LSVHGDVKLGDLGIARAAMLESHKRGLGPRAKGKLGYLAPEQISGRHLDQRGDVFAAAVVIAEMLLGRPLFAGGTEIAVLLAIRDGDVGPLRAIARELPEGMAQSLLRALEREPEHRTASADALRTELRGYAGETSVMREELGLIVARALDEEGAVTDRTSLAATVEKSAAWFDIVTPPIEPSSQQRFEVEGKGVFSLAELVRDVTTGVARASDRVRLDDGEYKPLGQHPELSRHLPPSTRTPTARRRPEMAQTSETYDLGSGVLRVLAGLLVVHEDGLLLCERADTRKEIYLQQGVPVFVTSNREDELLGQHLVAQGVVDRTELDLALAMMPRFEGRLGETLVALGLVDPVQLVRHITGNVRAKMLGLFAWEDGHASLYRHVEPPERAFPLRLDPWELLHAGALHRIDLGLEPLPAKPMLMRTSSTTEVALPPHLETIWVSCFVPRSLAEIEAIVGDPRQARGQVAVLLALGMLRWQDAGSRPV
jgi:eukaryotic-like serine/threonine-protein kinase